MPIDFHHLRPAEERRLGELLRALRAPVESQVDPGSWLVDNTFAEEFQSRLISQHLFMKSVVMQGSFDAALIESARQRGLEVHPAPDGQRFWDVEIGGRKISLKSTQARDLRRNKLHISKLTEAAWIQDCRTARMRQERVRELFEIYTDTVKSIIQLRYFRKTRTYELVEMSTDLMQPILRLGARHFQSEGPSVNIPVGQDPPDFTLKLDRSDSKITLSNIAKQKCLVHGTWVMPTL